MERFTSWTVITLLQRCAAGIKTQQNSAFTHGHGGVGARHNADEEPGDEDCLLMRIWAKNVQSIQSDTREMKLIEELAMADWDLIALSETWRTSTEEIWRTSTGHLFLGASCTSGRRGVAILILQNHVKGFKAFQAVNERICSVDINLGGFKFRFISLYMPDNSYDDDAVKDTYVHLSQLCKNVRRLPRRIVITGDWNAVVGSRREADEDSMGMHAAGPLDMPEANGWSTG